MKKLEISIEEFNSSGGLRILTAISNLVADGGIDVSIIYPDFSPAPFFPINSKVRLVPIKTHSPFGRLEFLIRLLIHQASSRSLSLTSSYRLLIPLSIAGFLTHTSRPIFLIQGLDLKSLIRLASTACFNKLINVILYFISQKLPCERIYVSNYLASFCGRPGTVIQNFISPRLLSESTTYRDWFKKSKFGPIRIGWIGNQTANKGFDLFFEISKLLDLSESLRSHNVEFVCASQDRNLGSVLATSKINLTRPTSDDELKKFYEHCDIFLSLSVSEGFSLPTLEAMAAGCIVLTTNSGGISDFAIDGVNSFVMTSRSARCAVDCIENILNNADNIQNISHAAIRTARRFTFDEFSRNYLSYFMKRVH